MCYTMKKHVFFTRSLLNINIKFIYFDYILYIKKGHRWKVIFLKTLVERINVTNKRLATFRRRN